MTLPKAVAENVATILATLLKPFHAQEVQLRVYNHKSFGLCIGG
jgi:hypothetical protein